MPSPGLPAVMMAILVVIALVALGFQRLALPSPAGLTAAPEVFSAARAAVALRQIARQPHPTGTPENAQVRAYLLDALQELGLAPEVQTGVSLAQRDAALGLVHNIVVRLPGRVPGKALLLVAHYDSAPMSPGAADDGASVAAILETIRALKSGLPLQNELVILLTDGEEIALLGARLFLKEPRFAGNIGLVLNFENRGNRGPVWMFETGSGNAKVVHGFAQAVAQPLGSSLLNEMYKVMPNDTDLTIFKRAGLPALNFAAADGYMSYHTQLDRPEALDPGTLQQTGDTMLALVRHFGNRPLDALAAPDSIYADVPLIGSLQYSTQWLWPLFLLCAVLSISAALLGRARQEIRIGHSMFAAGPLMLALPLLLALVCQLIWRGILLVYPSYQLLRHHSTYNSGWYWGFFVALALGLFVVALRYLTRWFRALELAWAAMWVWLVLLAIVNVFFAGVSFLLAWPLLPMLVAMNVCLLAWRTPLSGGARLGIWLAGAAVGCLLLPPIAELVYNALTVNLVGVPVLMLAMFLAIVTPILNLMGEWRSLRAAPMAVALACMVGATLHGGFDAAHPLPNNLSYVQPSEGNGALWASTDTRLDAWTSSYFPNEKGPRNESAIFGQTAKPQWLAAAPAAGIEVPRIELIGDAVQGATRKVALIVSSSRSAPRLDIAVGGVKVLRSWVQEAFYAAPSKDQWEIKTFGLQGQPVRIALEMAPGQAFRVWARDYSYGLPAAVTRPRPVDMMGQAFGNSDTTQGVNSLLIQ
jgi:Peptidase family M28